MTDSVDPDQTAPTVGAVSSGSTLFASVRKLVYNVMQLFAADDIFRCIIVNALRLKVYCKKH